MELVEPCEKSTPPLEAAAYHVVHARYSTGTPGYKAFGVISYPSVSGGEIWHVVLRGEV
jgi:hypothetical protein